MDNGKMDPDTASKIIMDFDIPAIRAEMKRLLAKPKCSAFIKQLLAHASQHAVPGNTMIEEGDILKVFDIITSPGQKGLVRSGDTKNGALPGANFASGSIQDGTARIQIGNVRPPGPVTMEELKALYVESDARFCIHETLHHCGVFLYDDQAYANAANAINGNSRPLPTPTGNPLVDSRTYSQYWDKDLRNTFK